MSAIAIRANSLSKRYRRGLQAGAGLRHSLEAFVRSPISSLRGRKEEFFWALNDVSLEVKEGEVLGLIGRNGAGKTTLLKILSRITRPTSGFAEIQGRIGSLLEVGTGFHDELTGRENTFLSGAILGMRKAEITRKFDEIVAFAELEKFIDTPVKHYSSGMYVRLAFAVAAHLEPEVLLVDEVLAVGDARFQKKCLGKMSDVARAGRTVVLVSHQLNQIRRLCHRAIWIDGGTMRQNGTAAEVLSAYEVAMSSGDRTSDARAKDVTQKARFLHWEITEPRGKSPHVLDSLNPVMIRLVLDAHESIQRGVHGVTLYNAERQIIWGRATYELEITQGVHEFTYEFPMLPVKPGGYTWNVSLWDDDGLVDMSDLVPDMIVSTESCQQPLDEWSGLLNIPCAFSVRARSILQNSGER